MTVRVVYGVGCLLHLHVKVILTTSYGRRGISASRFFYCICPWGAAGGNIYNMNMKKTLLLLLLALLTAPLWGQKTYGEATTEQLRQQANNGDAIAQTVLGYRYQEGDRAPKDDKQAVYWWTKAANQGYALAQYRLGICYYKGEGVEEDCGAARYWFLQAEKKRDELSDGNFLNLFLIATSDCTPQKPVDPTSTTAPRTTAPTKTTTSTTTPPAAKPQASSTTPRSPVSTSTSTSTPSYTYSGSSKYGRWPWYYHGVDYGVHLAYIQRAIYARDAVSGETGYADVFGEEGWSKGFQVGMHFNPLDDKEILAMNSGFYLEMLFDKWENAPSGYYDNYYEFNLHVPLEMVLYLPFGRESALHLRAGLGADFSCLAKVTDWDDSYMPSQEVDYGEGFINRFNLSLNLGVSFRFEGVMLHATYQKGLLGHPFSQGYRCTLDKLSLGLSFVVDD